MNTRPPEPPWRPTIGLSWEDAEGLARVTADRIRGDVATTLWTRQSADWERPGPAAAERGGRAPVGRGREDPPSTGACMRYGFDGEGRLILAEALGHPTDEEVEWLTIIDRVRDEPTLHLQFFPSDRAAPLQGVTAVHDRGQRTESVETWFPAWNTPDELAVARNAMVYQRTVFTYRGGRLESARTSSLRLDGAVERYREDVAYGGDGSVASIHLMEESSDDPGRITYRRRTPASVRKAMAKIVTEFPERIERWARRAAPDEPVWCLAVLYPVGPPQAGMSISPSLALSPSRQLAAWRSELPSGEIPNFAWNPAEFAVFDSSPQEVVGVVDLEEACALLVQEWEATRDEDAMRRLYVGVAERLAERDWSWLGRGGAEVSVFAVDEHLEDLSRNLRVTVAEEVRARVGEPPDA